MRGLMTAGSPAIDAYRIGVRLLAGWTAVCAGLWLSATLASPVLLALLVIGPVAWCLARSSHLPLTSPSAVVAALAGAGVYLFINAWWSLSPSSAFRAVGLYFLIVAAIYLAPIAWNAMENSDRRAAAKGVLAGAIIGG